VESDERRCGSTNGALRDRQPAEGVDFVFWREGDGVAALSADERPDPLSTESSAVE